MSAREKVSSISARESILRDDVVEIIYSGDWEIKGWQNSKCSDITDFFLIDEDKVAQDIIAAVREADRR